MPDNDRPESSPLSRVQFALVVAFLAAFAILVLWHMRSTSPTHDETWHLTAGYTFLRWDDYRMSPDHPPLLRKWAALPLTFMNLWPTDADLGAENESFSVQAFKRAWIGRIAMPEGAFGLDQYFFYAIRDDALRRHGVDHPWLVPTTAKLDKSDFHNDPDRLLFWGRLPMLAVGLLLGVLVFAWARELFGVNGALSALALYCFDPNFIAHGGLVTVDVGLTTFVFGAIYFFWRTCRDLTPIHVGFTALFLGLAIATKPTAVFAIPMLAALGLIRIVSAREWKVWPRLRFNTATIGMRFAALASIAVIVALGSYVVLWASYGFRFSMAANPGQAAEAESMLRANTEITFPNRPPGHPPIEDTIRRGAAVRFLMDRWPANAGPFQTTRGEVAEAAKSAPIPFSGRVILFCARHHLLPEAFLFGFSGYGTPMQRTSFLRGEYSMNGFRDYFLWTFLYKTPEVTMIAIVAAMLVALRGGVRGWHLAFLLMPVAIYLFISVRSRINIGHRHILLIYPFLYVLCGCLAFVWMKWKPSARRWSVIAALVVLLLGLATAAPHFLTYFNQLAGGPRSGHRHLVDSNLDWGQGLVALRRWLDARGIDEPIHLCYFGVAAPRYYIGPHINLPGTFEFAPSVDFTEARLPGYIAISATNLEGAYFSEEGRAKWRKFLENATLVDIVGNSIFVYRKESP